MKIVQIVPGFGGTFYCGNCLRDSSLVAALRRAGHETVILPVYLPLVMEGEEAPGGPPVFYGAVSMYVKQMFPSMHTMPGWLHKLLNTRPVLRFAAARAGSTRAQGLEEMTRSMLLGEDGGQRDDLKELVRYLKEHEKPDVVHLSNALLLGMAGMIRREVGVPVICSLQDEDVWIDAMKPAVQDSMWELMGQKAAGTDAMIAVSEWFGREMIRRMKLPAGLVHTVPIGIDTRRYHFRPPALQPRTIGYLSRLCEENGLGILVDAFILLRKDPAFRDVQLIMTGGHTGDDKRFIREQKNKLKSAGLEAEAIFSEDFSFQALEAFFSRLTLLSVPVLKGEAFGMYLLESMASGIPVVQPAAGAFPEIIGKTGGGLVYQPHDAKTLAEAQSSLLGDPSRLNALSVAGRAGVEMHYEGVKVAGILASIYVDKCRK